MCTPSHLDELLRRWEDARRQGRPAAPEELCRDCPELLEPLRRGIAARERADAPPGETVAPGAPGPPPWPGEAGDAPGAEPVPGYRLVRRLGEGGFGEVWQAEGPGGFPVALKFIRPPGRVGEPELRALEITKRLRHPNLLAVFGAWQAGGRLVIAMDLAERSLLDRLREVRAQGLSGIPRDELLEYMREAAKGVDFLNEPRVLFEGRRPVRVQHRDLKPHNILLVGGGVKVADFGLARLLEGAPPGRAVVLAPPYAAPEFFAGHTSRHSDQYSLAVTYCQLRGGRLPFEGAQAGVMLGHVRGEPDLRVLPDEERRVVARALAKDPEARWPDCATFVRALERARNEGTASWRPLPVAEEVGAGPAPAAPPARPGRRRWRGLALAAALLAVLAAGRAAWRWFGAPNRPAAPEEPAPDPDDEADR